MGLKKEITLDNGIKLNYHRIVSVNKITNNSNIIEVASYIDNCFRDLEKEALNNNNPMNIFIETSYVSKEYNETETIEDIYNYLKTLEKFKNAENA